MKNTTLWTETLKISQSLVDESCSGIADWVAICHYTLAAISAVFIKQSDWEGKILWVFAIPLFSFLELFMTHFVAVVGSNLYDGRVL